eukprot:gnl/Dysnectes_brevis/5093_a7176_409.p1 GENE.gnl/Dysnectes_brevis/5093_a7176_409~~gnl/Dysnectes_brevis/5093_a7176_409.p1  ORF type:complete len:409 (+),score=101.67 gnl/Dysnectes_brevis/5093_a7176_409:39-1265(+)
MGRKKYTLSTYLIAHPSFHLYIRRHIKLSSREITRLMYRNQSQFSSEFKWIRRTYGGEEFIVEAMKSLPSVIEEINCSGLENPAALRSINCSCPLCQDTLDASERKQLPPVEVVTQQLQSTIPGPKERIVFDSCIHDQLCFRALARQLLVTSFRNADPLILQKGVRQPVFNAHTRTYIHRRRVTNHSAHLCLGLVPELARLQMEAAAITRALKVHRVMKAMERYTVGGPVSICSIPPGPFLPGHCFHKFAGFSKPVDRPGFPLARPEDFGPPITPFDPRPEQICRLANTLFRDLSLCYSETPPIKGPSAIVETMQRTGCLELLVAVTAVTGCGSLPFDPTILPEALRLPPPGDPRQVAENWQTLGGIWAEDFTAALEMQWDGNLVLQMVQLLQQLQVLKLCDHLLGSA